jgi:hypothetical protein
MYGFCTWIKNEWQWWLWHKKCYPAPHLEHVHQRILCFFDRESHFMGKITKLHQYGLVSDFITTFEQLDIRIEGLSNEFYLECLYQLFKRSHLGFM